MVEHKVERLSISTEASRVLFFFLPRLEHAVGLRGKQVSSDRLLPW